LGWAGDQEIAQMQVNKLTIGAEAGLVPAGQYFAKLARSLDDSNAREAERRAKLDAEDRELEAHYRRASASRSNTYSREAAFA
jgi:hypothetical protein